MLGVGVVIIGGCQPGDGLTSMLSIIKHLRHASNQRVTIIARLRNQEYADGLICQQSSSIFTNRTTAATTTLLQQAGQVYPLVLFSLPGLFDVSISCIVAHFYQ